MKITLTWARRTLKAVDETIGKYKSGIWVVCPLCKGASNDCDRCPWMIFKKNYCLDFDYTTDSIPLRLRRLYGWRVRLLNIIRKFEEATKP